MLGIVLENLTVVPVSLSTVLLEWKVIPSDRHHCITSYNIQVSGQDGSQWEEHIPGGNQSFLLSGMKLEPLEEYTYCVTVNIPSTQTGPTVKQTSLLEVQGMYTKQNTARLFVTLHPVPSLDLPLMAVLLHGLHAYQCTYINVKLSHTCRTQPSS